MARELIDFECGINLNNMYKIKKTFYFTFVQKDLI